MYLINYLNDQLMFGKKPTERCSSFPPPLKFETKNLWNDKARDKWGVHKVFSQENVGKYHPK